MYIVKMLTCCFSTKSEASLENALLDELSELNRRMSKIIKQLKYLKPAEYETDYNRFHTSIPVYQQVRARGYSAPPILEMRSMSDVTASTSASSSSAGSVVNLTEI
jgi:hypothetical protein